MSESEKKHENNTGKLEELLTRRRFIVNPLDPQATINREFTSNSPNTRSSGSTDSITPSSSISTPSSATLSPTTEKMRKELRGVLRDVQVKLTSAQDGLRIIQKILEQKPNAGATQHVDTKRKSSPSS